MPSVDRRLPFPPLAAVAGGGYLSTNQLAERLAVHPRQVTRWQRQGFVRLATAEDLADRLGLHPTSIWGRQYHDELLSTYDLTFDELVAEPRLLPDDGFSSPATAARAMPQRKAAYAEIRGHHAHRSCA